MRIYLDAKAGEEIQKNLQQIKKGVSRSKTPEAKKTAGLADKITNLLKRNKGIVAGAAGVAITGLLSALAISANKNAQKSIASDQKAMLEARRAAQLAKATAAVAEAAARNSRQHQELRERARFALQASERQLARNGRLAHQSHFTQQGSGRPNTTSSRREQGIPTRMNPGESPADFHERFTRAWNSGEHFVFDSKYRDDEAKKKAAKQKEKKAKAELKKNSEHLLKTLNKSESAKAPGLKEKVKKLLRSLADPQVSGTIIGVLVAGIYTGAQVLMASEEARMMRLRRQAVEERTRERIETAELRRQRDRLERQAIQRDIDQMVANGRTVFQAQRAVVAEPRAADREETRRIEREQQERAEARRREREAEFARSRQPVQQPPESTAQAHQPMQPQRSAQPQRPAERNFEEGRYGDLVQQMREAQTQQQVARNISLNRQQRNLNRSSLPHRNMGNPRVVERNRNGRRGFMQNAIRMSNRAAQRQSNQMTADPRYGGLDMDSARNLLAYVRRRCRL